MKIKKIIGLISLCLCFCMAGNGLASGSPQDRFKQANQLYEEGKISESLHLYQEIEKNVSHWKLFYNIGNCYYKLNQPIRAKIYYLKARRLEPFQESIQNNIEIVNKQLNDKIPIPKPDFITDVLLRIESVISLDIVSFFLLIFVFVFNGFALTWIKKGKSRIIVYGVAFSLVLTLLAGAYHIYRAGKFNQRNIGVITQAESQLRSGPGETNTILFKVNPGLEVKIIEKSGNWIQVSASSDIAGWIETENVEQI
jgi:hypothetical protein